MTTISNNDVKNIVASNDNIHEEIMLYYQKQFAYYEGRFSQFSPPIMPNFYTKNLQKYQHKT